MTTISQSASDIKSLAGQITDIAGKIERLPGTSNVRSSTLNKLLDIAKVVERTYPRSMRAMQAHDVLVEFHEKHPRQDVPYRVIPIYNVVQRERETREKAAYNRGFDAGESLGRNEALAATKHDREEGRAAGYAEGREPLLWKIDAQMHMIEKLQRENAGLTGDLNQAVDRIDELKRAIEPKNCKCGYGKDHFFHKVTEHPKCFGAGATNCRGHVFGTATILYSFIDPTQFCGGTPLVK